MFDAFTGVVSALWLLVGSLQASYCLLVTWLVVTLLASAKHLGVVITHDWTDQVKAAVRRCLIDRRMRMAAQPKHLQSALRIWITIVFFWVGHESFA